MKFKKIAAVCMVATMTVSPITAFAADSAQGTGTIEGYVVEDAFSVVLPVTTNADLAFKLDPQSLLKISDGTNYGSETAGSVIFTATKSTSSPVIYATNKSSYPVILDVDVAMTNDATNPVTFITDKSKVNADTALNVYFAAVPEQNATTVSTYTTSKPSTKVALPVSAATSKSKFDFKVAGSKSNFEITYADSKYAYTPIASPTWDSVGFTLTGLCNKDANWDAYNNANGTLTCNVAWTMTKQTTDTTTTPYQVDSVDVGNDAYGLVNATTVPTAAPTIATTTYALTASTAVDVTTDLGLGSLAATGISSVTYNDGTTQIVDPANYTFASGKLTFTSAYVDTLIAASTTTRTYTVTFNDAAKTAKTVTLTYTAPVVNKAGGVTPTAATFSKATGASVAIDLGSGTGAVTGIKSVATVVNSVDYPWTADTHWSFTGTALTLKPAAQISALAVDATRTIKVTFNNDTTDTFTVTIAN